MKIDFRTVAVCINVRTAPSNVPAGQYATRASRLPDSVRTTTSRDMHGMQ
jgi:hypothetical protein